MSTSSNNKSSNTTSTSNKTTTDTSTSPCRASTTTTSSSPPLGFSLDLHDLSRVGNALLDRLSPAPPLALLDRLSPLRAAVPPAAAEAANFTSDSAYTLNGHALRMDEKQRSLWITTPRAQETPRAQGASPSTEEEEVFVPSQDPSPVAASPIEMAAISTVSTVAASLVEMVHKGGEKRGA